MQKLISTAEAAERLDINQRHVVRLVSEGKIKAQRVGRAWLVVESSLKNWQKHPTKGRPKPDSK